MPTLRPDYIVIVAGRLRGYIFWSGNRLAIVNVEGNVRRLHRDISLEKAKAKVAQWENCHPDHVRLQRVEPTVSRGNEV